MCLSDVLMMNDMYFLRKCNITHVLFLLHDATIEFQYAMLAEKRPTPIMDKLGSNS
jgi:hypothetical protein